VQQVHGNLNSDMLFNLETLKAKLFTSDPAVLAGISAIYPWVILTQPITQGKTFKAAEADRSM